MSFSEGKTAIFIGENRKFPIASYADDYTFRPRRPSVFIGKIDDLRGINPNHSIYREREWLQRRVGRKPPRRVARRRVAAQRAPAAARRRLGARRRLQRKAARSGRRMRRS